MYVIFTDASDWGYGGSMGGKFLFGDYPESWRLLDIQVREFYPILIFLILFKRKFANCKILLRSDNASVVAAINHQTSKNRTLMQLLRTYVLILLKNNITCRAKHIEGAKNTVADALSRQEVVTAVGTLRRWGYSPELIPVPMALRPHNWPLQRCN